MIHKHDIEYMAEFDYNFKTIQRILKTRSDTVVSQNGGVNEDLFRWLDL